MDRSMNTCVLLALFLAGIPGQACKQAARPDSHAPDPGGYSVTDALNRTVRFQHPPRRIVLTGRALFMIADAL